MRSPLALAALLPLHGLLPLRPYASAQGFVCQIPTAGCVNGMFSVEKCECECIPPYCLYEYDGSCSLPSGNCDDPWESCVRGQDCPWWINPVKDETCTTGPEIPANVWSLFNTQEACCNVNFLYSTMCLPPDMTHVPTKHPTITVQSNNNYSVKSKSAKSYYDDYYSTKSKSAKSEWATKSAKSTKNYYGYSYSAKSKSVKSTWAAKSTWVGKSKSWSGNYYYSKSKSAN